MCKTILGSQVPEGVVPVRIPAVSEDAPKAMPC